MGMKRRSPRLIKEPHGLGPPYERCSYCYTPTPYWIKNLNIPCCQSCFKQKNQHYQPGTSA